MAEPSPRVNLGMPVYNGIRYVELALDSLLGQDYDNFDLTISDNGSTDGTSEVCQRYAARDSRIRYERQPENRGAIWNFNHVLEVTRGEFFGWTAHDDLWAPSYLTRCVESFQAYPDAVLVHPQFNVMGNEGERVGDVVKGVLTAEQSLNERYREIILGQWSAQPIYGLIRRSALERTQKWKAFLGAEYLLLAELAVQGRFVEVPEALWTYRHTTVWSKDYYDRVRRALLIQDQLMARHAPWVSLAWELVKIALRAPLPEATRLRLALEPIRWVILDSRVFPAGRQLAVSLLGEERFGAALAAVRDQSWYRSLRGIQGRGDRARGE